MMSHLMLFLVVSTFALSPANDLMVFPQWEAYTYKTYSGMIEVGDGTRSLHYVFIESQNDPTTDPVVLWLNGGPGCSSLLGMLEEIGPQVFEPQESKFSVNPYSWNKKANLLFLESPAGVGFSTNTNADYEYTDINTGADNYEAIKKWFTAFTQFKDRSFWISGESYAGMYIPYTAKAIIEGNKISSNLKIKLQGVLIGNGLLVHISDPLREEAMLKYFMRRNFMDKVTQNRINNICGFSPNSVSCQYAMIEFYMDCLASNINPYNVYGYCAQDSAPSKSNSNIRFPYTSWMSWNKYADKVKNSGAPCSDFGTVSSYLNLPLVKQALHVGTVEWEACNMKINQKYNVNPEGSYKILPYLYENGLKVLIYSGDQDVAVSVVETEDSLLKIPGLVEQKKWTAYGNSDDSLAGWVTEYNYLTFVVIRGAGHMVPTDQRQNGYEMFQNFIDGTNKAPIV